MSQTNIWEAVTLIDLATLIRTNLTVILGLTLPETDDRDKQMIRKFLKEKSKHFPLITFVYMEVPSNCMGKLGIINKDKSTYPILYHIRDGNKVMTTIENADEAGIYEDFAETEAFYVREMIKFQKLVESQNDKSKTKKKAGEVSEDTDISDQNVDQTISESVTNVKKNESGVDKKIGLNKKIDAKSKDDNKVLIKQKSDIDNEAQIEKKKNAEKALVISKKLNETKMGIYKEVERRKKLEMELLNKEISDDKKKKKEQTEDEIVSLRKAKQRK